MDSSLSLYALGAVGLGYLLGSIPFGLILAALFGEGDIRKIGSGNIGATNVLRTGRKGLAAATLVLDALKGAAAVLIAQYFDPVLGIAAGAAAFVGHLFPIWLKFKGGKGVATMLGVAAALSWPIGLAYAIIWLAMLFLSRISSLSGMVASLSAPLAALSLGEGGLAVGFAGMALILILKHSDNIRRIVDGSEPRVGSKSK